MPSLGQTQIGDSLSTPTASRSAAVRGDAHGKNGDETTSDLASVRPPLPRSWHRRQDTNISNELLGISLGLFGLRAIPLVDRQPERDHLWSELAAVHDSRTARQVLVQGAAGTGKSELVHWLAMRAREVGGARVLTAYHSPVLGPADGLVPMMERFLGCARLNETDRRQYLASLLVAEELAQDVELAALASIFEERGDGEGSGRVVDREQRYAIIYRYLSRLARRRPVIVWLDDVQWGLDALGFARYVADRQKLDPAPLLVAMTARTEALADRANEQRTLSQLLTRPAVARLELAPLERDAIEVLVRQLLRLNQSLARHILERSEGVPLFAVQLVGDWVARGKLVMGPEGFELRDGANIAIPDDIYALWDDRIHGFLGNAAAEAIGYLELAAALGQEVDLQEWRQAQIVAGLPVVQGLTERLVDEGLARSMEAGWRFYHGMLQESLERRAREAGRWARWNRCCAEAIGALAGPEQGGHFERLAWHWAEAGEPGKALAPLGRAIDEAIRRSDYDRAAEFIEWRAELTADEQKRWILANELARARLAARLGDYRRCVEVAEAAIGPARKLGAVDLAAQAQVWAGAGWRALGDLDRAQKLLAQAADHFVEGDKTWLARAHLEQGRVDEQRGAFEAARQKFEKARAIFASQGDAYGQAQALNAIGDASRQGGDMAAAHKACLQALERYRELENIAGIADCLNDLAESSRLAGNFEEAQEFADEARRLYDAVGSGEADFVRLNQAMIDLESGAYGRGRATFSQLVPLFRQSGQQALAAQAIAGFLASAGAQGDWTGWQNGLQEIEDLLEATGVRPPMAMRSLQLISDWARQAGHNDLAAAAAALIPDEDSAGDG